MSDEELESFVRKELSDIRRDIAHMQQMTTDLIRIVGNTNGMLEEVQQDVNVMKQDIDVMKQDIEAIKQEQKRMSDTQEQRGRVLEMLSYRSLAHDADIRDLRRVR